jgi:hypothetical protein
VSRPKHIGMEIGDGIGYNFFDGSPDSQFIPGVVCN